MKAGSGVTSGDPTIILVSTNVSEQMGGEAIKALQIALNLKKAGFDVHQVAHERVKPELDQNHPDLKVSYVKDTRLQKLLYGFTPTRILQKLVFFGLANKKIYEVLKSKPNSVVHFTSPISPVLPHFSVRGTKVVIGPLNGNIHYPIAFRNRETPGYRLRRVLHPLLQFLHGLTSSGNQRADVILVSGGRRTFESLRMARCRDSQMIASVDSGVPDGLTKPRESIAAGT
jgi:hypothetical protein